MADIKQAAQWMLEGRSIRRPGWWCRYKLVGNGIVYLYGKRNRIRDAQGIVSAKDLLAEDWEIAE